MTRVRRPDKCGAKKKQGPGNCTRPAGWGTDHVGVGNCKLHLGNTPSGRKAAADKQVQQQAKAELARLDVQPVADPLRELAALAGQIVAWKDVMAGKVNELTTLRYDGGKGSGEQLRSEVALFERAMDRCQSALTAMARLNIDERLARITERQQEIVLAAVAYALTTVGLDEEQKRTARDALVRYLREAK